MGSFLCAHSGHRMVQKPYKDSGSHRLRPDKDPDLVRVYKNHVSHKSKRDETTTTITKRRIQFYDYVFVQIFLDHIRSETPIFLGNLSCASFTNANHISQT